MTEEVKKIETTYNKLLKDVSNDLTAAGYFVGIIVGIIGLIIIIIELHMFYKINNINKWVKLKDAGIIIDSFLESTTKSVSYSILFASQSFNYLYYRTRISFNYKINGIIYTSNKFSYYEPWDPNPTIAEIDNNIYKIGTIVDIIVNPKNIKEAYIVNKKYHNYTKLIIGIALLLIGIYSLWQNWHMKRIKKN